MTTVSRTGPFNRATLSGVVGVGVAAAIVLAASGLLPLTEMLRAPGAFLARLGWAGDVVFVLCYAIATATVSPSGPFAIASGLMFGAAGLPIAVGAATCGGAIAFLISRHFARARIVRAASGHPLFQALDRAIDEQGWLVVGLARMSPVIPFNVLSYLLGVSRVGLRPFIAATAVGIIPNTLLCVYVGAIGRTSIGGGATRWVLTSVGLAATVVAVVLVSRAAKRRMLEMMAK